MPDKPHVRVNKTTEINICTPSNQVVTIGMCRRTIGKAFKPQILEAKPLFWHSGATFGPILDLPRKSISAYLQTQFWLLECGLPTTKFLDLLLIYFLDSCEDPGPVEEDYPILRKLEDKWDRWQLWIPSRVGTRDMKPEPRPCRGEEKFFKTGVMIFIPQVFFYMYWLLIF